MTVGSIVVEKNLAIVVASSFRDGLQFTGKMKTKFSKLLKKESCVLFGYPILRRAVLC